MENTKDKISQKIRENEQTLIKAVKENNSLAVHVISNRLRHLRKLQNELKKEETT